MWLRNSRSPPSHEPAVLISERELERIIERLEDCKPAGWGDLWLAGVGAGVALVLWWRSRCQLSCQGPGTFVGAYRD